MCLSGKGTALMRAIKIMYLAPGRLHRWPCFDGAKKFVMILMDKAVVNPTNIMGASKLIW